MYLNVNSLNYQSLTFNVSLFEYESEMSSNYCFRDWIEALHIIHPEIFLGLIINFTLFTIGARKIKSVWKELVQQFLKFNFFTILNSALNAEMINN